MTLESKNSCQSQAEELSIHAVEKSYGLAKIESADAPSAGDSDLAGHVDYTERLGSAPQRDYAQPNSLRAEINYCSGPLWDTPIPKKRHFDWKQIMNALYFAAAGICLGIVLGHLRLPHALRTQIGPPVMLLGFFLLSAQLIAFRFALVRPKPSDFEVTLPLFLRNALRCTALILPIPLFLAAPMVLKSQAEFDEGSRLMTAARNQEGRDHLNWAVTLNPFNEQAWAKLAYCQNRLYDYPNALIAADRALQLRRRNASAWADKAWALNKLTRYKEALPAALRASRLNQNNGEAFAALANAYVGLDDYEKALEASTKHVALHSSEVAAYTQRAEILEVLGQSEEAQEMRDQANSLK
jgi:Flp pilus assembly protein TadD